MNALLCVCVALLALHCWLVAGSPADGYSTDENFADDENDVALSVPRSRSRHMADFATDARNLPFPFQNPETNAHFDFQGEEDEEDEEEDEEDDADDEFAETQLRDFNQQTTDGQNTRFVDPILTGDTLQPPVRRQPADGYSQSTETSSSVSTSASSQSLFYPPNQCTTATQCDAFAQTSSSDFEEVDSALTDTFNTVPASPGGHYTAVANTLTHTCSNCQCPHYYFQVDPTNAGGSVVFHNGASVHGTDDVDDFGEDNAVVSDIGTNAVTTRTPLSPAVNGPNDGDTNGGDVNDGKDKLPTQPNSNPNPSNNRKSANAPKKPKTTSLQQPSDKVSQQSSTKKVAPLKSKPIFWLIASCILLVFSVVCMAYNYCAFTLPCFWRKAAIVCLDSLCVCHALATVILSLGLCVDTVREFVVDHCDAQLMLRLSELLCALFVALAVSLTLFVSSFLFEYFREVLCEIGASLIGEQLPDGDAFGSYDSHGSKPFSVSEIVTSVSNKVNWCLQACQCLPLATALLAVLCASLAVAEVVSSWIWFHASLVIGVILLLSLMAIFHLFSYQMFETYFFFHSEDRCYQILVANAYATVIRTILLLALSSHSAIETNVAFQSGAFIRIWFVCVFHFTGVNNDTKADETLENEVEMGAAVNNRPVINVQPASFILDGNKQSANHVLGDSEREEGDRHKTVLRSPRELAYAPPRRRRYISKRKARRYRDRFQSMVFARKKRRKQLSGIPEEETYESALTESFYSITTATSTGSR